MCLKHDFDPILLIKSQRHMCALVYQWTVGLVEKSAIIASITVKIK